MVVDMLYMLSEFRWHFPSFGCTIPARRPSKATWVLASEVKIRRWEAPGRQPICVYSPSDQVTVKVVMSLAKTKAKKREEVCVCVYV